MNKDILKSEVREQVVNITLISKEVMLQYLQTGYVDNIAEAIGFELYKAGYHKPVWHKVADGDLPETYIDVLIEAKNHRKYVAFLTDSKVWLNPANVRKELTNEEVIAWTELPIYQGN